MNTLLLDQVTWDLCLDASGNMAVAAAPYALAQDAASEIKTFEGEVYYDTTRGVPYYQQILGHFPPVALMKAAMQAAALRTPGLVAAKVYLTAIADRKLNGQVHVTDQAKTVTAIGF